MQTQSLILAIILLFSLSCQKKVDIEKTNQELLNTDLSFSTLSVEKGKNKAFSEYIHPEGVLLRENGMPYIGKKVLDSVQSLHPDTSYTLKWKPLYANVALSGELGYTYGIWKMTTKDTTLMGTYATVWKKDNKGQWKFILDTGNDGLGSEEERLKSDF